MWCSRLSTACGAAFRTTVLVWGPNSLLVIQFPANMTGKKVDDNPSAFSPASHMEVPKWRPSFQLGTHLTIALILVMNQWIVKFSFSLLSYLFLFFPLPFYFAFERKTWFTHTHTHTHISISWIYQFFKTLQVFYLYWSLLKYYRITVLFLCTYYRSHMVQWYYREELELSPVKIILIPTISSWI